MKPLIARSNTLLNGLLLGWTTHPDGKTAPVWDTAREGHLITIAPTGSGKGVSCAIPALLTWQGPVIVVDPRGENYAVTANRRRAMGHIVYRLDPFGITGEGKSDSLNPMDLIDPHADDFEDNAAVVAQLCMQNLTDIRAPYWDERASVLVSKIICELYRQFPDNQPTLRQVQEGLRGAPLDEGAHLMHPLFRDAYGNDLQIPKDALKPRKLNLRSIVTSAEFASERTRAAILSTASSHLGFLKSKAVNASLSNSTIHLDDITGGAMQTIYIIIPPEKLVTHSKLLRLWIGVMLAAISRRRRAPAQPTLFLIDEAAQLGEMDGLRSALTLMRAYGVRVWTFWQCISQLQTIYPTDWQSIINNSTIQQFFGAKTPHARKNLAMFLGDDMPKTGIPQEQQILFDGEAVRLTGRPNYLTDDLLKGLAAPHPFHTSPSVTLVH